MLIKPRRVRGAAAAKEWDHFSDDMRVRKILLGRQCTQRVPQPTAIPFGSKIEDFAPA